MRTLMEVVRLSAGYLGSHGSESPRLDAELLAAHALALRRLDLYLQYDHPLGDAELAAIRALVRRRGDGEPVAHITGRREFHGRAFRVSRDVLIPRPETETLVELALAWARSRPDGESLRVADVATGSGCIAVTLAAELPGAEVAASDVSSAALAVARTNLELHSLEHRVELLEGSWGEPLAGRQFDMIVSNPPYIARAQLAILARDVRDHEPVVALDGGPDGLDAYRGLLPSVAAVLAPDGWVALEVDIDAAEAVAALAAGALGEGTVTTIHPDLSGRPRVVTATRPAS
jgi:release factor glutamine methyltransferase